MVQYSLRPAADKDYNFLYRLHAAAIRPAVEATWGWDEDLQREYFRSRWDPTHRQIIRVGEQDVGALTLKQQPDAVFLAAIEVDPDYQGQGIGASVIRDVISKAHKRGLKVRLHALKTNAKAIRLYLHLGFRMTEEKEDRIVMEISVPEQ